MAQWKRGTAGRSTGDVPQRKTTENDDPRATSARGTQQTHGNSGTFVGTETKNGLVYARYRAEEGTWVSSSLSQLGYARVYGKELAYGAYADIVIGTDGEPL